MRRLLWNDRCGYVAVQLVVVRGRGLAVVGVRVWYYPLWVRSMLVGLPRGGWCEMI